ncbi:hypothetical protein [Aromatoleum petrolei]|uniref:Uncharacterized protein n=1 Tax=Aromatoleum petrolei TaxID=76116 RepID=A0ABX1MPV7_9RHOO|nr:hypothetical protein [Aromatoleum petrolei]NMF89823.1 hypothetical protein [Aromatoleum petrolei]QTQ35084.1 Uncharacterized protein ToN1_09120 [Aromatoleum petrolei]
MATIVIKDLPENMDLDRQAMQAITGGARLRGTATGAARTPRLPGSPRETRGAIAETGRRPAPSTLFR